MMKKTAVLGLGISGIAAAKLLATRGVSVIGLDACIDHKEKSQTYSLLEELGVALQSDKDALNWAEIQELVVSPGVSPRHPVYEEAKMRCVSITGEAELALPHLKQRLVAITGTNGKTTVTLLIEHILNQAGVCSKAVGNVGLPLCEAVLEPGPEKIYVVELSSYQLETMKTPVFELGVILNITPDHLDRYSSMRAYAEAKSRLQFLVQKPDSLFVQKEAFLNYRSLMDSPRLFGWDASCSLWTDKRAVLEGEKVACLLPLIYKDKGEHDYENTLAAWAVCAHLGISSVDFSRGLETFQKPPHRIEWIREVNGVSYYDDSKGTNIDAVVQAVRTMRSDVILIAGGVDKGASYLPWKELFQNKVKQIIALGQSAPKIHQELHPSIAVTCVDSLEQAVNLAAVLAKRGDSVLLSPGCSSFDLFRDYVHRGKEFQNWVARLRG